VNNLYKIATYLLLGIILSFISIKLESSFVEKFSENILALLSALFAINIANSTIIASKLYEINKDLGLSFKSTLKELKLSFYEQIILIAIVFVTGIIRESNYLHNEYGINCIKGISDSIIFFSFIYYVDIMIDLGKAIFNLINFDNNSKK